MAQEKPPSQTPIVIDAVDNITRGIADDILLRESQGFIAKGINLVLDASHRLRVHPGQKLINQDEKTNIPRTVGDKELPVEGIFSLDNRILVAIVNGQFYYYGKEHHADTEMRFIRYNRIFFPEYSSKQTRRYHMVKHDNLFIFTCNDNYYRPVAIYLTNETEEVIEDETNVTKALGLGIAGYYLGLPKVVETSSNNADTEITINAASIPPDTIKDNTELYHYAFCFFRKSKGSNNFTRIDLGPIVYKHRVYTTKSTHILDGLAAWKNGGIPTIFQNNSYYVRDGDKDIIKDTLSFVVYDNQYFYAYKDSVTDGNRTYRFALVDFNKTGTGVGAIVPITKYKERGYKYDLDPTSNPPSQTLVVPVTDSPLHITNVFTTRHFSNNTKVSLFYTFGAWSNDEILGLKLYGSVEANYTDSLRENRWDIFLGYNEVPTVRSSYSAATDVRYKKIFYNALYRAEYDSRSGASHYDLILYKKASKNILIYRENRHSSYSIANVAKAATYTGSRFPSEALLFYKHQQL